LQSSKNEFQKQSSLQQSRRLTPSTLLKPTLGPQNGNSLRKSLQNSLSKSRKTESFKKLKQPNKVRKSLNFSQRTLNSKSKSVPNLKKVVPKIDPFIQKSNAQAAQDFANFNNDGGIIRDCVRMNEQSDPWNAPETDAHMNKLPNDHP
jgi:hypothetical protein